MQWRRSEQSELYEFFRGKGFGTYLSMGLAKAGVQTMEEAEEYLGGTALHEPALIRGIDKAVEIIERHIEKESRICILGDYDADGITASALLFLAFRRLGAKVKIRLPDRMKEGYGIGKDAIEEQVDLGTELFVTVDTGIRAVKETETIHALGKEIVILDHHEPGEELPRADAVIDLHIPGESYPFLELTGAGLAWKVAFLMLSQKGEEEFAMRLIDLAAIGTIADVAPLHGENRSIVKLALRQMCSADYEREGVRALIRDLSHVTAEDIAFRLVPALNAPGRLEENGAKLSVMLLLERDFCRAKQLAAEIVKINDTRKKLQAEHCAKVRAETEKQLAAGDKILVLFAENAPKGIVGLLAGRLKEEFQRPTIVFASDGENRLVGSARSVESFHILEAIEKNSDLLLQYGGHRLAAGLTISKENLEVFRKAINETAKDLSEKDFDPVSYYDLEPEGDELDETLFSDLIALEPFGAGAPKPVLKIKVKLQDEKEPVFMGQEGKHLKLFVKDIALVGFSLSEKFRESGTPASLSVYGTPCFHYFQGKAYPQILMRDLQIAEE